MNQIILAVEDMEMFHRIWSTQLAENSKACKNIELIFAVDEKSARKEFEQHRENICGILMDYSIKSINPELNRIEFTNTLELTRSLRGELGFKGPIIAASGDVSFRFKQMRAGCSHKAAEKADALLCLLSELKQTSP